ncbi:MAG: SRPBCC family protein [Bacteroidetes bacterium]|jgi:carbon monoxide dehydrogenase subunit G|nr:SRPBCC family protein [Bacteroidota bacterium]MDF1868006.1 SRPBCC family protein [Saprospiraceae bacterium]
MKFKCQVDIDLPINKVIELFDNPDNMKEWQDGFERFEHLSGVSGEPGAKAKITYDMGKRGKMELIETVLVRNLPHEFSGTYEHKHMTNSMKNSFEEVGANKTRWVAELHYTKLNGFMIKMMAFFFPRMFKKQTQKWMDQFKVFAERVD